MVKIIVTSDYEVFMGENYTSYDELLCKPAYEIGNSLASLSIPISFFVDVLFIRYLQEKGCNEEYEMIVNNIRYLHSLGHSIELHIHPHWKYSEIIGNQIIFDKKYYSMPKIEKYFGKEYVIEILEESIQFLKSIMAPCSNYKINAFRAGGWSIQPEKSILCELKKRGVKIDSSVMKNNYSGITDVEYFDFRHSPKKDYWNISPSSGVNREYFGFEDSLIEVPVTTISGVKGLLFKCKRTIKRKLSQESINNRPPNGKSCLSHSDRKTKLLKYLFQPIPFSLDNYYDFPIFEEKIKKYSRDGKNHVVCFYFHPKLLDEYKIERIISLFNDIKTFDNVVFESIGSLYYQGNEEKINGN